MTMPVFVKVGILVSAAGIALGVVGNAHVARGQATGEAKELPCLRGSTRYMSHDRYWAELERSRSTGPGSTPVLPMPSRTRSQATRFGWKSPSPAWRQSAATRDALVTHGGIRSANQPRLLRTGKSGVGELRES